MAIDRIKFSNPVASDVADAAFVLINATQSLSVELQVAGLSMAFVKMCRHLGVDPSDAFTLSDNILSDKSHGIVAAKKLGALTDYITNEIK
jgi:hypothetical protein